MDGAKSELEKLLSGIPDAILDKRIGNTQLQTIAKSMRSWRDVAPYLGLTEADEEDILNDHRRHQEQKSAALRKWREKTGGLASYRNLAKAFYESGLVDTVRVVCEVINTTTPTQTQDDPECTKKPVATAARVYPSDPPKMKELMKLLYKEVPEKWSEIGTYLEVRSSQLASIKQENLNNPQKCLLAMLDAWLQRVHPPPTWEAIAEAVELVGREDVAQRMAAVPG